MDSVDRIGSTVLRLSRLALYLAWTVPLMPVQAIGLLLRRPWVATFPRFYHRWCCRILGLRVRRIGHPVAARPVLFAANHISYIDITVFGSLIAGSFVAKSEVAGWPLFGWLARLQRTVFIDRRVRSTVQQRDSIAGRLAAKGALILFPEGTSGNGNRILPFKSALFSVADRSGAGSLAVQPVSIAYTRLDGMPIGRALRRWRWRRICGGCWASARSRSLSNSTAPRPLLSAARARCWRAIARNALRPVWRPH